MKKKILDHKDVQGLVSNICREITIDSWRPDYVVGLTRGGLIPAVMISQYLNVKMNSLDISLRDGGDCVNNCSMSEDAYNGKKILIVDDINDTGATFNWLTEDWKSSCLPFDPIWNTIWTNNVRFTVLVDNLSSKCNVKMNYVGFEVNKSEQDVWIDFPWENWWTK
jgi:hypoxanthine phosphoribosyltransferase